MQTLIDFDDGVVVAIPVTDGFSESGVREFMLLEGPQGWGEFSAPRQVDDRQAARWLTAATEPGTVGWPDPVRGRIPVAVYVPSINPAQAHRFVVNSGCCTAEVSVADRGGSITDDIARLEAVRDALGAGGQIRCDARGAWDVDTAASVIPMLSDAAGGLEYVEQPCATVAELAQVRRRVDVRIAADATRNPARASLAEAADVAVLTVAPLGGVRRSLRVAEFSELPCVVAAGPLTSIGLAAAVALAGALPELPYACGVRRPPWLTGDVITAGRSLVPVDGYLPVAPMPPAPDPDLLARYTVTDRGTLAWWRQRLQNARTAL